MKTIDVEYEFVGALKPEPELAISEYLGTACAGLFAYENFEMFSDYNFFDCLSYTGDVAEINAFVAFVVVSSGKTLVEKLFGR